LFVVVFLLLGTVIFLRSPLFLYRVSRTARRPNILFIVIETLRADHLGCYGYTRQTSPHMDWMASKGILFENFYSVSPWTLPTIASLFAGIHPQSIFPPADFDQMIKYRIPKAHTLAAILKKTGYHTIGFIEHPVLSRRLNYDHGFELFHEFFRSREWQPTGGLGLENLLKYFRTALFIYKDKPWFVYMHLIYPHHDYQAPEPYRTMFGPNHTTSKPFRRKEKNLMINAYDGEIRYTDEIIKHLYQQIEQLGLLDQTVFIITSDHGEGFWEHGERGHGRMLYNEVLHIPLIIHPPGGRDRPLRIRQRLSNIDLFPTILDLAGVSHRLPIDGQSLAGFWRGENRESETDVFSEACHTNCINSTAFISKDLKMIYHAENEYELYDMNKDPSEKRNLAADYPKQAAQAMIKRIQKHRAVNQRRRGPEELGEGIVDEKVLEQLRSLGYLQ